MIHCDYDHDGGKWTFEFPAVLVFLNAMRHDLVMNITGTSKKSVLVNATRPDLISNVTEVSRSSSWNTKIDK